MADLAAHLARSGVLGPAAVARALAEHHDGPAVDLSKSVVPVSNLDALSPAFCRERGVLPASVSTGEVVLAVSDPDDRRLADEVRFLTGRAVLGYAAVRASIDGVLDALARERARGARAWRGPRAPRLPDPDAAWVGVVHAGGAADTAEALALAPPDGEAHPASAPAPVADGLAVVADASAEARAEAAALLAAAGLTVLEAAAGDAALELVRASRPALLVADALLPAMPGFEACRAVKGDAALRGTRVILASALHPGPSAADARAAFGADAVVEKPWVPEQLAEAARALLAAGGPDPAEAAEREAAAGAAREGAMLLRAGRVEEAMVVLREAAERDGLSAEAHHLLGVALARQGLFFQAAAAFTRAAELRPAADVSHEALAVTLEALGFRRQARAAWARAAEAAPEGRRGALHARLARLLA